MPRDGVDIWGEISTEKRAILVCFVVKVEDEYGDSVDDTDCSYRTHDGQQVQGYTLQY